MHKSDVNGLQVGNPIKVISLAACVEIAVQGKASGKTIAHCHGVFDVLHLGHIRHLNEAKSLADILIVTITPDAFVNKGPRRPLFTQEHRAEMLAALECVDYVATNNWPDAIQTIELLCPDFYVKGPDYKYFAADITGKIDQEAKAIQAVGGELKTTSGITFSSSNIINTYFEAWTIQQQEYLRNIKKKYPLKAIQEKMDLTAAQNVLVLGEVIIDEYVFSDTMGKSGKEPMLVTKKLYSEKYAGGALSIANTMSGLCKEVNILTYLGEKSTELDFIQNRLRPNVDLNYILKSNSPTIQKTRFVDNYSGTKTLGVYDINDELLSVKEEDEICKMLRTAIQNVDMVIVADYGHGLITPKMVDILTDDAKFLAINTQINASNIGYHTISKYPRADFICIHEGELRHDYRDRTESIEALTRKLSQKMSCQKIIISQGKHGSFALLDKDHLHCPAFADKIVDRIGAGDTLFAVAAAYMAAQLPADLILLLGNLAAAHMVAQLGTNATFDAPALNKALISILK